MNALRRTLYLQAAVWAFWGLALSLAPRLALVTVLGQPRAPEYAWFRLLGVHGFGLSMFMVLVGHRIEDLWWWAWGFALVTALAAAIVTLNAAFGVAPGQSSVLWWVLSSIMLAFSLALLYGLFLTSRERPLL